MAQLIILGYRFQGYRSLPYLPTPIEYLGRQGCRCALEEAIDGDVEVVATKRRRDDDVDRDCRGRELIHYTFSFTFFDLVTDISIKSIVIDERFDLNLIVNVFQLGFIE